MSDLRLRLTIPISLAVSLGILYLVVKDINWSLALEAIQQLQVSYVVLSGVAIGLGLFARGFRWHDFLCGALPYSRALRLTFLAFLLNNILPLRLGDLARIEAASHGERRIPRSTALSVAGAERLIDLVTLGVMFLLALPGLSNIPPEIRGTVSLLSWVSLGGVAALIVLVVVLRERVQSIAHGLEKRVGLLRRVKFGELVANFIGGLEVLKRPKYLMRALFWNVVGWLALIVAYQLFLLALFPQAKVEEATLLVIAIALSITVPTTVASLGLIEAGAVLALTSQGYPYEASFAIGLTSHVVTLITYTLLGGYALWSEAWTWPKKTSPTPPGTE